ncbi:oligosaccharide flippase family protein [Candidatus Uhrbacteria bacterium]|nr:oligosaccharide flippase family protein [Candidatus Uhrbacteria bacterium]
MSRLGKNTLQLTLASVVQKALAFLYFLFLARLVGTENTGDYFLALSVTTMFSVLTDMGLQPVLIRTVAKGSESWREMFAQTITLKVVFSLLAALLVLLFVSAMGYAESVRALVGVAILVMLVDAITLTMYGLLRGVQVLTFESVGMFVGQGITVVVGVIALILHAPLVWLVVALLAGSAWNAVFSTVIVVRRFGISLLRPALSLQGMRHLLYLAVPFALSGIFVKGYSYLDTILLSTYFTATDVGYYAVAYKLTYAFQFLPMAFAAALYPAMSAYVAKEREKLSGAFEDAVEYMMVLATPIAFGIWAVAPELIVQTVGQEFLGAVAPLQILVFATIPLFLDFPVGSLLNAAHRQTLKTSLMGATFIMNAAANIFLVPRFGTTGAATAALGSFLFLFFSGLLFVPRITTLHTRRLLGKLSRILLVGGVMALIVYLALDTIGLFFAITFGAIVYVGGLWIVRVLSRERVKTLLALCRP